MRLTLVGPGRAGTALALAARSAGHQIIEVSARRLEAARATADLLDAAVVSSIGEPLHDTDLVLLAVRDDAIAEAAAAISAAVPAGRAVVHLSGLAGLEVLGPLSGHGIETGSFHPLQTLPDPEHGARALPGSWIAITTPSEPLAMLLEELARSIGAAPFRLEESAKALYHAAASAASNLPVAVLAMAADLFDAAGVPFEAAAPLVRKSVENVLDLGPRAALTGPVARGDVATVEAQLDAVAAAAPEWLPTYRRLVGALAALSGRAGQFEGTGEGSR